MKNIAAHWTIAGAFAALTNPAAADVVKDINLDAPGALEALRTEGPDHFRRVSAVYEASRRMSCYLREFRDFVRENFGAQNAVCGEMRKTLEYPSKGTLSFELDSTRYSIGVTILPDEKSQRPRNAD